MTDLYSRRTLLRYGGVAVAAAIAGCGGDSTAEDTDEPEDSPTPESTPTTTSDQTQEQPSVDEFLSRTDNYDGIVDMTGSESVTVDVGVEANGAYYGFGPAAIRVDAGTAITWEWTGQGSTHNVVARHGADFRSEQRSMAGATYGRTFDEPGTVLYVCVPHEGTGMKGAIIIE